MAWDGECHHAGNDVAQDVAQDVTQDVTWAGP